jgi:solute carrier family 6 GABA transporter-like protein 6/8/11/12/13
MYLEFSIGQFTRRGPIGAISKICPLLKGTGIATVFISFFLSTYYVVIIAWALYFLFASFASEVPWSSCNNTWNTQDCWDGTLNSTLKITNDSKTPSEEFFRNKILNESKSIEDFGMPKWDLVLLVLLVWIIIYFSIWKGVKSTGKVVYVTATFPFLVLTVMLLRGVTLDGAEDGLRFFFVPKWELLLKPSVWANAAIQNFNSIGVAFGGLISMSSYNKPNKRIFGDVLVIAGVDALTSIICGSTVFSVLGYIAKTQGKQVEDILEQGPGLVFMVLPEAIRNMEFSPLWAIIFFLMIFMLGIDSQFTQVETLVTTLEDEFCHFYKKYLKRREFTVLLACMILFFLSLPNLCPGGIYYFTIIDFFSAGISVFYVGFFEIIAISWFYGGKRLASNIYYMNGERVSVYIYFCWYFITPTFIFVIWMLNWIEYTPITYGEYEYSGTVQGLGWCIAAVSLIAIPLGAVHSLIKAEGDTFYKKLLFSIKPTIHDLEHKLFENRKGDSKSSQIKVVTSGPSFA